MKIRNILIFSIFFLAFIACQQRKVAEGDAITIDFQLEKDLNPNDLLQTHFIKLETKDVCLINKGISQLEYFADKIFILSGGEESNLFVFDQNGKFLNTIGSRGNGPGEFIVPVSFAINQDQKIISIVDIAQKKIIDYDLEKYTYIAAKGIPYYSSNFEYVNDNQYVFKNSDSQSDYKNWEYLVTDSLLNVKEKAVKKDFVTGYNTGRTKSTYKVNNQVFAYSQYNPRVYKFNNGSMEPYYNLKFGNFALPTLDYLAEISNNNQNFLSKLDLSGFIYYFNVFETNDLLNVYYTVSQEPYLGLHNKFSHETYCMPKSKFEEKMKIGVMDRPSGTIDNYVAATLQPFDLKEKSNGGYVFNPVLKSIIDNTDEEDNPILFLYKFKD